MIILAGFFLPVLTGAAESDEKEPSPITLSAQSSDLKPALKLWKEGKRHEYFKYIEKVRMKTLGAKPQHPKELEARVNDFYALLHGRWLKEEDYTFDSHIGYCVTDIDTKAYFISSLNMVEYKFYPTDKPEDVAKAYRTITVLSARMIGDLMAIYEPEYKTKQKRVRKEVQFPPPGFEQYSGWGGSDGSDRNPLSGPGRRSEKIETFLHINLRDGLGYRLRNSYRNDLAEMKRVYALAKQKDDLRAFFKTNRYWWSPGDELILAALDKEAAEEKAKKKKTEPPVKTKPPAKK
jgi:hypothetical protein